MIFKFFDISSDEKIAYTCHGALGGIIALDRAKVGLDLNHASMKTKLLNQSVFFV